MRAVTVFLSSGRPEISPQIAFVNNSLFTTNWRCYSHPLCHAKYYLEARFELKFFGTYRLRFGFLMFGQVDYLIYFSDLLEGFRDKAITDCMTTLRYALSLATSENLHSCAIGLLDFGLPNNLCVYWWLVRTLGNWCSWNQEGGSVPASNWWWSQQLRN